MATKLGAVSSLQKPFRPHDLLAAVARSLSEFTGHRRAAQKHRKETFPPTDLRIGLIFGPNAQYAR